jgi:predicted phage terminase large subunit-like protein
MSGKKRIIGTNYHFRDLYQTQSDTGAWTVRRRVGTDDGTINGKPHLLTPEQLQEKRRLMGSYVFSCQFLLNPVAEENQVFKEEWLRYWKKLPEPIRLYGFVDPANSKKEKATGSDYTAMVIMGLDSADNYFLVDALRDRLSLTERWVMIRDTFLKWRANGYRIMEFFYEQYGMVSDTEHFEHMMGQEGIQINITPIGGKLSKPDRIKKLQPLFENKTFFLPIELQYKGEDMVKVIREQEYLAFPYAIHDDILDAASRVVDRNVKVFRPWAPDEDARNPEDNIYYLGSKSSWAERKSRSRYAYT